MICKTSTQDQKRFWKSSKMAGLVASSLLGLTGCGPLTADLPALLGQVTAGGNGEVSYLSGEAANGTGNLAVSLASDTGRSTQAVAADVKALVVSVQRDGQPIARLEMAAGQSYASFDALQVGPANVDVTALDGEGSVIGQGEALVTIVAGQTATIQVSVQLTPTVLPGGGLVAQINLIDGPTEYASASAGIPTPPPTPAQLPIPMPLLGAGMVAPVAAGFASPEHIAFDADRTDLFVANLNGNSVSKIDLRFGGKPAVTVFNASIPFPHGICVDPQGNAWVTRRIDRHSAAGDVPGTMVYRIDPSGNAVAITGYTASSWAGLPDDNAFWGPTGITCNPADGRIYVANTYQGQGYVDSFDPATLDLSGATASVEADMYVSPGTLAHDTDTGLSLPNEIAFDKAGTLWIADQNGPVRTARPNGVGGTLLQTFCPTHAEGLALMDDGRVLLSNNWGNDLHQTFFVYGPTGAMISASSLHDASGNGVNPTGLALAGADDLFIADYTGGRIVRTRLSRD